jgi:hypothetical protein
MPAPDAAVKRRDEMHLMAGVGQSLAQRGHHVGKAARLGKRVELTRHV